MYSSLPTSCEIKTPNQENHLFLKRQDHSVSVIGGLILAGLTLAASIFVYVVMQRQAESLPGKSLEASLQSVDRALQCRA